MSIDLDLCGAAPRTGTRRPDVPNPPSEQHTGEPKAIRRNDACASVSHDRAQDTTEGAFDLRAPTDSIAQRLARDWADLELLDAVRVAPAHHRQRDRRVGRALLNSA